ncbi:propionyl-coenzyme A carboxylase alpha polypeptide [Mesorhizobium sp. M2A.F.Ca.ET.046.03.2.1]|nr:propionyl-coenzyme A carboxylase alpha polypeptide [Mesorhizobium sp. M2A.F.Ca.ET.046.03.2.1]
MTKDQCRRSFAPPSGLPAISPTWGEIRGHAGFRQSPTFQDKRAAEAANLPLVGEMSGRTERGAVPPAFRNKFQPLPR